MNELLLKYNSLDNFLQHQVIEFIDYLISTRNIVNSGDLSTYKKKILDISTWSEQDIQVFNTNRKLWKEWEIAKW